MPTALLKEAPPDLQKTDRALWLEAFGKRPSELRVEVADALLGVTVTA